MPDGFRKTVSIDFDGVIHRYSNGWQGGEIYDPPVLGTREALRQISEHYNIVISTVREDHHAIWVWLEEYHLAGYISRVTSEKPIAVAYVDDRAVEFTPTRGWDGVINRIDNLASGAHMVAPQREEEE